MELTLLGTGTSQGIPVIGCHCEVCQSQDTKDQRLRTSAAVRLDSGNYVQIDCGPDFRQQMLRAGVEQLSDILITHEHMDHIAGLDDVRAFNFQKGLEMNVYATSRVQERLRFQFDYAFSESKYPGAPRIQLKNLNSSRFEILNTPIIPLPVLHGNWPVMGFRIGRMAYITDVNQIPDTTMSLLGDLDVLVLGVLHIASHHSHYSLQEGIEVAKRIGARRTVFTHISHRMGLHDDVSQQLPEGVELGYDGMEISFQ